MKGWKVWGSSANSAATTKVVLDDTAGSSSVPIPPPKPGFIGNLSNDQLSILQNFKIRFPQVCEEKHLAYTAVYPSNVGAITVDSPSDGNVPNDIQGLSSPIENVSVNTTSVGDKVDDKVNVEETELTLFLLRFLRARQFNIEKASLMLDDYLKWRVLFKVHEIREVIRFPFVKALKEIYPHGYNGVDKLGRPIYIDRIGKANIGQVLKLAPLNHLLAYWVQQYEFLCTIILPACSIAAGRRIEQGVSILDLTGLGFGHLSSQSRGTLSKLAALSQNNYPELLGNMVVVNAPTLFGPAWAFAKSILDPVTVSKISLYTHRSSSWKANLLAQVDGDQLPQFLAGTQPDSEWMYNSKGPWTDPVILEQLKKMRPDLPRNFMENFGVLDADGKGLEYLAEIGGSQLSYEPSLETESSEELKAAEFAANEFDSTAGDIATEPPSHNPPDELEIDSSSKQQV